MMNKILLTLFLAFSFSACVDDPREPQAEFLVCNDVVKLQSSPGRVIRFHNDSGSFSLIQRRGWNVVGVYTPVRGESCSITPAQGVTQPETESAIYN